MCDRGVEDGAELVAQGVAVDEGLGAADLGGAVAAAPADEAVDAGGGEVGEADVVAADG